MCLSQEIITKTVSVLILLNHQLTLTHDPCPLVHQFVGEEAFVTVLLSDPRREKHLANPVSLSAM